MPEREQDFSFKSFLKVLFTSREIKIIALVGFFVFVNMLFNGFVWDDHAFILQNEEVQSFDIGKIFGPSYFNSLSYYRPLPAAYFFLLYSIVGNQAFLYHIVQLFLHLACTIAVYGLFRYFLGRGAALLLSLIFLVHPMNVESVSYISATTSQLYALPGLLALLLLQQRSLTKMRYAGVGLLLLVSLLAKEEALLLLFISVVFVALFRRSELKRVLVLAAVVLCVYLFIRFAIGGEASTSLDHFLLRGAENLENTPQFTPISHLSFPEKLFNIPAIVLYYMQTFVFPLRLVTDQIWVVNTPASVYLPLIIDFFVLVGIATAGVLIHRRNKRCFKQYLFFVIWFLAGLLLHLPIIIPVDMTVADRWFYFTMIGLLGMLGVAAIALLNKQKSRVLVVGIVIILIVLSMRTIVRNTNYVTHEELFSHDAQLLPNYRREHALGELEFAANNRKAALVHFQNSDRLYRTTVVLYDLGVWYELDGNIIQASKYYLEAYQLDKARSRIPSQYLYQRLGDVMLTRGEFVETRQLLREGLQFFSKDDLLWYQLAVAESVLQNREAAFNAIDRAIAINSRIKKYHEMRQAIGEAAFYQN